jgi:hypothetical protein
MSVSRENQRECLLRVKLPDFCILSRSCDEVSGWKHDESCAWNNSISLPARLDYARNFSLEGKTTEAQTAYAELPQEGARTTAELAAVVLAGLELGLLCIFDAFCGR